jgi:hypothetical protein
MGAPLERPDPIDNSNADAPTNTDKRDLLLEESPYEADGGQFIGRHPQDVSAQEWLAAGAELHVGLKAIRAKCLDCVYTLSEVRKCVQHDCSLWPLRMGRIPKAFKTARTSQISSCKSSAGGLGPERAKPAEKPAHGADFEPEDGK